MDPTLLPLVLFLTIGLIVAAVLFAIRDIVQRSNGNAERLPDNGNSSSIAQLPEVPDMDARVGTVAGVRRWFRRLLYDTGLAFAPDSGFFLIVGGGLTLGGAAFVWRDDLFIGLVAFLVGMLVVTGILYYLGTRRRAAIQQQLPEVMELIARAVRAGESVDQALALVAETANEPLGTEFRRCAGQIEMGLSVEGAMRALARRAPLVETRILATTFTVQRETGGDLPVTLDRLAKVIRDRLNYRRQYSAATAASRISTFIIALAAPLIAVYLLIWAPDYIESFLRSTFGRVLLGIALVLQIIGIAWIIRLLRTDY